MNLAQRISEVPDIYAHSNRSTAAILKGEERSADAISGG
jgi:hypothetical protein